MEPLRRARRNARREHLYAAPTDLRQGCARRPREMCSGRRVREGQGDQLRLHQGWRNRMVGVELCPRS
jgi:hypothetical protein